VVPVFRRNFLPSFQGGSGAISSSEIVVIAYEIIQCHNPEDQHLYETFTYKLHALPPNIGLYINKNSSSTATVMKILATSLIYFRAPK
jgi:hypothetical protein